MAGPGFPDPTQVPQDEMRVFLQGLLANPNLLPESFLGFLVDYLAINQPMIPVELIQGYSRNKAQTAEVTTAETTNSTTFTDLATAGPSITGLSSGIYMITFGASSGMSSGTVTNSHLMSVSLNGAAASDTDSAFWNSFSAGGNQRIPGSRSIVKTLDAASNSIVCKYRVTGDTYEWKYRWLIAQRIGNA